MDLALAFGNENTFVIERKSRPRAVGNLNLANEDEAFDVLIVCEYYVLYLIPTVLTVTNRVV